MDAAFIINEIAKYKKNKSVDKEKFSSTDGYFNIFTTGFLISFFIGVYAAYLSYTCNTKRNMDCGTKVVYAILANMFGLFYLIYYFLFNKDHCPMI
jgi:hypothetical protein